MYPLYAFPLSMSIREKKKKLPLRADQNGPKPQYGFKTVNIGVCYGTRVWSACSLSAPRVLFALGIPPLVGILAVRCLHELLQLFLKAQVPRRGCDFTDLG